MNVLDGLSPLEKPENKRTKLDIQELIFRTYNKFREDYSGMTYEEGIRYALDWLFGESDEDPMPYAENDND